MTNHVLSIGDLTLHRFGTAVKRSQMVSFGLAMKTARLLVAHIRVKRRVGKGPDPEAYQKK